MNPDSPKQAFASDPNVPFSKPYSPSDTETRIYETWEKSGFFNPDTCIEKGATKPDAPVFSIVLPPPNVTGTLHMGSALMLTIEDIVVRFARMQGKRTLWIPGTDHAAIATQSKVEKEMHKEGLRKHDLGRPAFLERVNAFAKDNHDRIVEQVRALGSSLDWSREAFTLDEPRERAVRTAFKRMYDDGLIYRKYRVVNWDPKGQTTISDDEIVYEERQASLYTFKYAKDFPISIATSRPETKVGDAAVAVHPEDARYKQYIGQTFTPTFAGVKLNIKIVGDDAVDPAFGTGAVGVTPAHSMIDWQIAERHGLPVVPVIDEYAKMTVGDDAAVPGILGKKTLEARATIVEWIKAEGLMEKEETITQNISTAERTGAIVEPLPKLQWFIAVNKEFEQKGKKVTLKTLMHDTVANKETDILPERYERVYFNWINNLADWCISRQIWYGHQIPVWYKGEEIYVGLTAPESEGWIQDSDTLDTWFSSGLWTFSTLGWPDKTADLETYHPTTLLETGYDIIFFWVARMILMSQYLLGETPFKTVYLHGLVRDKDNKKISKSLGNNIDPVDMIKKYGADAVRMSLITGNGPGNDTKMSEDKIKAQKNFANKIWNATRFVLLSNKDYDVSNPPSDSEIDTDDKATIEELRATMADITKEIEAYHLYLAAEKLYHYFWHTFADIIIERSKTKIFAAEVAGADASVIASKRSAQYTLHTILIASLKALHPFMPFITEEIWRLMGNEGTDKRLLMIEEWPAASAAASVASKI